MSSSSLLQQCLVYLVRLTWTVYVMGAKWLSSSCFVGWASRICLKQLVMCLFSYHQTFSTRVLLEFVEADKSTLSIKRKVTPFVLERENQLYTYLPTVLFWPARFSSVHGCLWFVVQDRLTWVPGNPSIRVSRLRPTLLGPRGAGLTCFGRACFIAWCLRHSF